jgi:hypothetical protein
LKSATLAIFFSKIISKKKNKMMKKKK